MSRGRPRKTPEPTISADSPRIEVTSSNAEEDRKTGKVSTPGLLRDRSILNVEAYIDPEPGKAYKFCSPDPRCVAKNRRQGWTPVRRDDKPLPSIGGQVLCELPEEIRNEYKEGFLEEARIMSRRHSADEVARKDPERMFGKETRWI